MITPASFQNRVVNRSGQLGQDACQIMAAAIQAVDPYQRVMDQIRTDGEGLSLGGQRFSRKDYDRIFLIGFGKASVPMAQAVLDSLPGQIELARVITKAPEFLQVAGYQERLEVTLGGHPLPTDASVESTQTLLASLPEFTDRDLVLVVISGGGSALFTAPLGGITLDDLQVMTTLLLRSGADIQEINTLRKHIDQVKGGRLAVRLAPATVQTWILSDVIGDRLDMIASGPTTADPTTFTDAWSIIQKYHLEEALPGSITAVIQAGLAGVIPETLKETDLAKLKVFNHLVGTNIKAALAARDRALALGYHSQVISSHLTGLTADVAELLFGIIQTELTYEQPLKRPFCLILGGETTVRVTGNGKGGRNQDLVLRMVPKLAGSQNLLFISMATDGEDGPTDAAGAASDAKAFRDGAGELELNIDTYINTNNAYEYLDKTGALIKSGATGTNVNDLILILAGTT